MVFCRGQRERRAADTPTLNSISLHSEPARMLKDDEPDTSLNEIESSGFASLEPALSSARRAQSKCCRDLKELLQPLLSKQQSAAHPRLPAPPAADPGAQNTCALLSHKRLTGNGTPGIQQHHFIFTGNPFHTR